MSKTGVRAVMLLLGGCITACASRGLQIQQYILASTAVTVAAPVAGAPLDPMIGIGPIDVPAYLQRPEIVSRGADGRLQVRASERWGESLQAGIGRALANDLARLVPSAQVFREPFPTELQPAFTVALQVQRFEPVVDGTVELDAHWMVTYGAQRPHAAPTLRLESIREPISDATTEARVAAMSRAIAQLASQIAMEIRDGLAARTAIPQGSPPSR